MDLLIVCVVSAVGLRLAYWVLWALIGLWLKFYARLKESRKRHTIAEILGVRL